MTSPVETFSTVIHDGEPLGKVNAWLCQFRCIELLRFHAQRVAGDSTRIVLEAQDHKRLRILASNPPHQSFLGTAKTVPFIWITFTEPVDLASFQDGNTALNGVAVADARMTLEDNLHTLKIDTTDYVLTTQGQYELIFNENVRHKNLVWRLYGERKVIWTTSEHGGSRGGEDLPEPDRSRLEIAKIIAEGQHSEAAMIRQMYAQRPLRPEDVVATQFVSGYPEFDRTVLYVIYKKGSRVPYVKCVTPEYKSCRFLDGAPDEMNIQVGFTVPVNESALDGAIYFDDVALTTGQWALSQNDQLLTITVTPAAYKHHMLKISTLKGEDFTRENPWMHSFVIHKATLDRLVDVTVPTPSDDDIIAWDSGGQEWVNEKVARSHMEASLAATFNLLNGSFLEHFRALATSDGATVTLSLDKSGGGDLTMIFSDVGFQTLDTTPAVTVSLIPGSDTAPGENFVYIPVATKVLTVSSSDWPTTEHIKVAYLLVQSAAGVQAESGTLINQNWNEMVGNAGQGHLTHMAERMRASSAIYHSGITGDGTSGYLTITTNVGTPDNVTMQTMSGEIYQIHKHVVTAKDTSGSDTIHVVNHPTTPYLDISDLNTQLVDAQGVSMSGRYFNLVFWGVANKTGEHESLMLNLPNGSYTKQEDAELDTDGNDVFEIPAPFIRESSTGFLIACLTIKHSVASGGTWSLIRTLDLRGRVPSSAPGSGASTSVTEFSDNQFKLFDESDITKLLAFQVSGVSTGTTRTLTVPDASGTVQLEGHTHLEGDITDLQSYLLGITGESVGSLSDVTVSTPANRHGLMHNGSGQYVSRLLVEADVSDLGSYITAITGEPLSDLSDVTITAIASGEILKWSGSAWVNNTLVEAGIAPTVHTHNGADIDAGVVVVEFGGSGSDLSATGGANQFLKQIGTGVAVTVAVIGAADLPNHSAALLTSGDLSDARLSTKMKTKQIGFDIAVPSVGTSQLPVNFADASTIVKIIHWCESGSVTWNLEERSSPEASGTDIYASEEVSIPGVSSDTSFDNAGMAADNYLALDISAISSPGILHIVVEYTVDD